jgi:hypothetical protein
MAQEVALNEKYENGVWYDSQAGEFCEIENLGDDIGLTVPGKSVLYYQFSEDGLSYEAAVNEIHRNFERVSDEAQEHPETVVSRAIDKMVRGDPEELVTTPHTEVINLMYARSQVEISEA